MRRTPRRTSTPTELCTTTRTSSPITALTTLAVTIAALVSAPPGTAEAGATPATTTVAYTGDVMMLAQLGVARLRVVVGSSSASCVAGRTVRFRTDADRNGTIEPDERWVATTAPDGSASSTVTGLSAAAYQVVAEVDATPQCTPAAVAVDLFAAEPGSQASGTGWYEYPSIGRAHLQFSARVDVAAGTGAQPPSATVRGNITWRIDRLARFNGTITGYTGSGCPTQFSTTPGARCGYLGGTGTLWRWGGNGRKAGWVKQSETVEFRLLVEDGSVSSDNGRTCTIVGPDRVRMYLPGFEFLSKTSGLLPLDRGRIDVT